MNIVAEKIRHLAVAGWQADHCSAAADLIEAQAAEIAYLRGDEVDPSRVDMTDETADLRDLAKRIRNIAIRHRCYSQARDYISAISEGLHAMAGHEEQLRKLAMAEAKITRLREALKPFAEICQRLGWHGFDDDDPACNEHIVEAPANDIAPGAVFCLQVSEFRRARAALAEGEKK